MSASSSTFAAIAATSLRRHAWHGNVNYIVRDDGANLRVAQRHRLEPMDPDARLRSSSWRSYPLRPTPHCMPRNGARARRSRIRLRVFAALLLRQLWRPEDGVQRARQNRRDARSRRAMAVRIFSRRIQFMRMVRVSIVPTRKPRVVMFPPVRPGASFYRDSCGRECECVSWMSRCG